MTLTIKAFYLFVKHMCIRAAHGYFLFHTIQTLANSLKIEIFIINYKMVNTNKKKKIILIIKSLTTNHCNNLLSLTQFLIQTYINT